MGILQTLRESRRWQELDDWRMLADRYQMPPSEFYGLLEEAVRQREVPETLAARQDYHEGSLLSDRRSYLRLTRDRLLFDCCAAPFGTGYLFSYWLWFLPRPFTLYHALGLLTTLGCLAFVAVDNLGLAGGLIALACGLSILFVLVQNVAAGLRRELEEFLHGLTVIGLLYELFLRRPTYFEIDTAYAFLESIRRCYLGVLDGLGQTHGLRALTDEERKPTMSDFFRK